MSAASAKKSDEEGKDDGGGGGGGGGDDDDHHHHKLHTEPNGSFSRIRFSTCHKELLQMEFIICVNSPAYWQENRPNRMAIRLYL